MTDNFPAEAQSIVGPLLADLKFTLDEIDDDIEEGGRHGSVVYYRSGDCKIQIYQSAGEGNVNSMIAPVDTPNQFGPHDRSGRWQYLARFALATDVSLEELVNSVSYEPKTDTQQLEWVKDSISEHFEAAHDGILKMFAER